MKDINVFDNNKSCNFDNVDNVYHIISMLENSQDFNMESLAKCIIRSLEEWGVLNPECVDMSLIKIRNILIEKNRFDELLKNKEIYNMFTEHNLL